MTNKSGIRKVCPNGHVFYKSSDCLTCPICEKKKKPAIGFLSKISAPARRALEQEGISTLKQVTKYTEAQLLELHGIGKSAVKILLQELAANNLTFKKQTTKATTVKDNAKPESVNAYIANFPDETQKYLQKIRALIKKLIPEIEEKISYGMPSYHYQGSYVIYFAGYKNHIGIYPIPTGNKELDSLYKNYKITGKATLQLPLSKPLPLGLIEKMVKHKMTTLTNKSK
jgi:uncharacterized protein YdhG (YjbR/CyaY superfamily)